MQQHLTVLQIVVALALCVSILLQSGGSGLGAGFGGDGAGYYSKRGFEKFLVYGSVVLATLFVGLSAYNVFAV
jgi:protein translocase SecG subunit